MKSFLISATTVFLTTLPVLANEALISSLENGRWGWPEGKNTCAKNPQTIRFADNRKTMTITWDHTHDPAKYNILYFDANTFTSIVERETRTTDAGDRVVWVLKVKDDTHFCWRRTDWPGYACTDSLVKCGVGS